MTTVLGMLLIGLGLGGYFWTGTSSLTALIPAAFGLALAGLGIMARDVGKRKLAMHIAVALAAVGYIAGVPGLFKLPMGTGALECPAARGCDRKVHHGTADGNLSRTRGEVVPRCA